MINKNDNTRRFEFIDSVLNGLEAFHYRKENNLDGAYFGDEKHLKPFSELMIMFDLEGGVLEWFRNRDAAMKKEGRSGERLNTLMLYLVDQICEVCKNESGRSSVCTEEMARLFGAILDGGIYDMMFLDYGKTEKCLKMFDLYVDYNRLFVYRSSGGSLLDNGRYQKIVERVRKRIKTAFFVTTMLR